MQKDTDRIPYSYRQKGDLTNGPIKNHLIRMTMPMIWGLLAVISVQLADTYFIALLGDTDVLAGISFTFPVTMLISHMIFGVNIALSSVTARLIGEKKIEDMRRVVLHGLMMAFFAAGAIALITYTFLKPLFYLIGADDTTFPVIADYMPLWLAASLILALPVNANSAMRANGDTTMPAIVMCSIAAINFVLDPLLIFGLYGFPEMGVTGAALATFLAYAFGTVLALYILTKRKNLVATDGLHLDKFKDSMKRLLVIAIPAGIANIFMPLVSVIIVAILAEYGPEAVAAFGVASRVEAFALLVVIALSVGMAPIIGQNWGAGLFERVRQTIDLAIKFNLLWSGFIALLLAITAIPLASLFSEDPQVIHYTVLFFWIVPISYGVGNLIFGWSSAFNAIGRPQKAFVMIFVRSFIIMIPAAFIGGWIAGATGVFIAVSIGNFGAGLIFHISSRRYCDQQAQHRIEEAQHKNTEANAV